MNRTNYHTFIFFDDENAEDIEMHLRRMEDEAREREMEEDAL